MEASSGSVDGRFADEMAVICFEVVAGVVDGVIVSGNAESFDVMAVSWLEVSNGILFEVVVFGSTDVVEIVKVVVVGLVIVVGSFEICDSVVSDICLKVVVCLLVCA